MSRLKVLEAITPSGIGGAEIFVTEFCRNSGTVGIDAKLLCSARKIFVEYAASRGVEATSWRVAGKCDPVTLVRLALTLRRGHFDVIHTHLSTASLLGAMAARLARVPSVAHVHGLNTATCFKMSSRIIAVSHSVKQHLVAQGIREDKIEVVYNGIDTQTFSPLPVDQARNNLGWDNDRPLVGLFGRLSEEKGQRTALEAMFLLIRDHPAAQLLIAGRGSDLDNLRAAAAALGIEDRVLFTGFLDDVRAYMSACDVIISPSAKEGFGLAAAEAMALERPVVAGAVGGLEEIVEHGITGYLIPPNDPSALAESVSTLLGQPDLRQHMGRAGREKIRRVCDSEQQMRRIADIFANLG